MRHLPLLIIVVVISSCASNRIRYVKDMTTKSQEIVESQLSEIDDKKIVDVNIGVFESIDTRTEEDLASIKGDEIQENNITQTTVSKFASRRQTYEKPKEIDPQVVQTAMLAESRSKKALAFSIAGLSSIFLPFIGVFLTIAGYVFYFSGNKLRYITVKGNEKLKTALGVLILDSLILLLWAIIILALLF